LPLAFSRRQQERVAAMVLDAVVRKSRKSAAPLPARTWKVIAHQRIAQALPSINSGRNANQ